jgi:hypothetical protein
MLTMDLFSVLAKVFLIVFGSLFLLLGVYLFVKTLPKFTAGSYNYITEKERLKRSILSGASCILAILGIMMIVSGLMPDKISFKSLLGILCLAVLSLPFGVMAGLGTYSRLWTFTKSKDDVVFLSDDKGPRN